LDKKGFDGGGWVPLSPHALDVLLQLFFCDVYVEIMEMGEMGQTRYISKTGDGVALRGEENGWHCGDEKTAEDGIYIVLEEELREEGLVISIVLRDFCVGGLVFA
jgi:hypothetical protein